MELSNFGHNSITCHMCKAETLLPVLDLGMQPHSDFFPKSDQLSEMEPYFPLRLVKCDTCQLLQIDYFVNPDYLYRTDYLYQSSTTKTGKTHYLEMAQQIVKRFGFSDPDLAVDIGSNVGVLLAGFKASGMKVLGVDPSNVAEEAISNGLDTIVDYFNSDTAEQIVRDISKAKIITGTNVFAHLHDLDSAMKGIKTLLDDDGVFVIEAPSALDLLENLEYDTIYHQHIGYLSVVPMKRYMASYDMEIFDVEKFAIHGGTIRYYISHTKAYAVEDSVNEFITIEEQSGMYTEPYLTEFVSRVKKQRRDLTQLLSSLKSEGKKIAAISAPAKGNTLLNYCKLDSSYLDFVTEKNKLKIGRYTPGTHLPIYSDKVLLENDIDYALILAWNFSKEIIENTSEFQARGGKFIVPIPYPKII